MRNLFVRILICIVMLGAGAALVPAQRQRAKTQEVKIYVFRSGEEREEDYSKDNIFGLIELKRTVDARAPLRNALIALTGDLTPAEERRNLHSAVWGIKFVSVRLERGTAFTYFTMPDDAYFSGDLSPSIFREAVEKTAFQFKSVKKVVVCLDGILDFESESEAPARKCSE